MSDLLNRLGAAGVSLVAAALIFGFLAGGVVIHRLQPTAEVATQQQRQQDEKGGEPKQSPARQKDQGGEQGDHQDTEASATRETH